MGLPCSHERNSRPDLRRGRTGVESRQPTTDDWIGLFDIEDVLEETEALLDGSSPVSVDRVARMEAIRGVLAL